MICATCTLILTSMGSTVLADSENFAGPYIGFTASGYGIEMAGTGRETSIQDDAASAIYATDDVQAGKVAMVAGIELGYAIPLGASLLLDIGGAYHSGEAKIEHVGDDTVASGNVSFTIDDLVSAWIAPTLALSDTSSIYIKLGVTQADIGVQGDISTPANLQGETLGIGTRTVLASGLFIRTEAGFTEYNGISAHGLAGSGGVSGTAIAATTSYSAEPTIAYGTVSIGFRF